MGGEDEEEERFGPEAGLGGGKGSSALLRWGNRGVGNKEMGRRQKRAALGRMAGTFGVGLAVPLLPPPRAAAEK